MSGSMGRSRGKVGFMNLQVLTSAKMPALIRRACATRGLYAASSYVRVVLTEAIARDLGMTVEEVVEELGEMPSDWRLGGAWHQMPRETEVK